MILRSVYHLESFLICYQSTDIGCKGFTRVLIISHNTITRPNPNQYFIYETRRVEQCYTHVCYVGQQIRSWIEKSCEEEWRR